MGYIAGVGGANMDIHGRSDAPIVMRDSNPGALRMSLGGVCRNICDNLALLGADVRLVTVVGDDANGRSILDGCIAAGIDMRAVRVVHGARSSCYVSLVDEAGDMLVAMSDMHIIKRLDGRLIDDAADMLCGAELVVCDGNLSPEAAARLIEVCKRPLYLDPVSTAWAKALRPLVGGFDTVKPNRMELTALTGLPTDSEADIARACDALHREGVRRVFVSMGEQGMLYSGPEGVLRGRNRPFPHVVNATGAGDAAMAGIIHATRQGKSACDVLHTAMAAGMLAISSPDTIHRGMSAAAIDDIIKEYIV